MLHSEQRLIEGGVISTARKRSGKS